MHSLRWTLGVVFVLFTIFSDFLLILLNFFLILLNFFPFSNFFFVWFTIFIGFLFGSGFFSDYLVQNFTESVSLGKHRRIAQFQKFRSIKLMKCRKQNSAIRYSKKKWLWEEFIYFGHWFESRWNLKFWTKLPEFRLFSQWILFVFFWFRSKFSRCKQNRHKQTNEKKRCCVEIR